MAKSSFSKPEKSWILYDVGNSAFILVIVTTIMPIFFKEYASTGIDNVVSTANWGFANSLSSFILAISAPILGTIADGGGLKKKFFISFLILGLAATFLLPLTPSGAWFYCLFIFVLARVGFAGSNIFYDAFLTDITEKKRMHWVSTNGYAWGYIGSVVPFLLVMAVIFYGMHANRSTVMPPLHAKIGFIIVGIWWLILSLPILRNVNQKYYVKVSKHPLKDSISRLIETFMHIKGYKHVFMFLIAYFFYIDGVDTIISMATAYGVDIGLNSVMLILAILMIQIVAFPFAIFYGKWADKFNAKNMLFTGIVVYCVITLTAFFLPLIESLKSKTILFWILAFLVATSMGGVQALSRSYFGRLIPAERSAEFFGFYNIFGKFAAILGPFLVGVTGRISGHTRYGVLSLFILFVAGAFFLNKVKDY